MQNHIYQFDMLYNFVNLQRKINIMIEGTFKFSKHIQQRIEERNLNKQWIINTVNSPDKIIVKSEEEVYFFKKIVEFDGRCLKVVFNQIKKLIVTAHSDRKMTKNNCK